MEETQRDSMSLGASTLTSSLSSTASLELLQLTDLAAEEEEFANVGLERQSIQLTTSKDHLLKTVGHDDDAELPSLASRKSTTNWSLYGCPVSPEKATILMPPGSTGLVWHANIVADDYIKHGKLQGLYSRDLDPLTEAIKPRRATLPITASDFFSSLVKVGGDQRTPCRWLFSGVLNGWPSLTCLEVVAIAKRRRKRAKTLTPKDIIRLQWRHHWSVEIEGKEGIEPSYPDEMHEVRATLRTAPWASKGWSVESPGFAFWFEAVRPEGEAKRVIYGSDMVRDVSEGICTKVHMISHRYAVRREALRDRLTYHSIVLLEWDHKKYVTVTETAYLNGVSGYKGQSNWIEDRDAQVTSLFEAMPPEMVGPWSSHITEGRFYDVPVSGLEEFMQYMKKYTGSDKRFLDPKCTFSHQARLSFRSKSNIAQYILNYVSRDQTYSELSRNCQTFAADLCGFLAGKKDVEPFHPVSRVDYKNRSHLFLYDSQLFKQ
eukprot:scaffold63082_cov54-Attheya_sp.AAC.2